MRKFSVIAILGYALSACSLAPTYQKPVMPIPHHFKEAEKWVAAKPMLASTTIGPWWQIFHDQTLNALEEKVVPANQNLKAAFARYQQANALVQVARSAFFPMIQGLANADRQKTSSTVATPSSPSISNNILVGTNISYELDVWGRVRNAVEQNQDLAKASAADLAAVTLSLQAQLASDYLALRGSDESQRILDATVIAYRKAFLLTKNRYQGGAAPIADVDEAETQFENAKTLAADMRLQRAQLEHAIAVLIGRFPADFSLPPAKLPTYTINLNPDLPSTLLQRRPDVAAAEFRVQAANANIGVARAAFFPDFNLSGVLGFQSKTFSNLLSAPSLYWSLGPPSALSLMQPIVAQTIFDGGKLAGLLKQAKASYYETVANYRQTVLTAFQEVEDNLVAIRRLRQEHHSASVATRAAKRALIQAQYRYTGGIITFLEVVVVENTTLQTELSLVNIRVRQQMAAVQLIKALGGGWELKG